MANQIRYQVGFDVQQNNLNQLKASLQDLQKMKISDIMKINDSDAASATSALNRIKDEAGKVEDALKQAFNTKLNTVNIETFNQSLKQSGTSIEQVYQAFRAAGSTGEAAFRSLSSQVLSTNIQLKETHSILDKMATTLANTVKWNAASAAVNGMTRSVEQAWGYVKSLDTSLNNIRIVTGKSAEEMGNFAVQANNAAKELGKTTTDYTNAALIYAQQGLSDKEIEERAKITLKTANVTGQSTADVSEELTAVWNGYKVSAEEAELYVDRLAAVAATTASDLEELSTGMSKVASAAAAMGVGEDQLAAQLSTIISVTRQAPESVGTALRTIYARISDIKAGIDEDGVTLGNYSGKMADLGFNVLDATGHLRDMGEVMEEIGGRWQDLTREQQISLAQTMAGQRQYNNLLALFDNFENYNQALNTAQNAAGTLQEQQDIYMESTAAHLQQLKAATEDVYDSLADTDTINGLIDGLTSVANLTANFVDSIGGGEAVLRSLGAIGITVFSEQIAKGINTTITNLEIGKENARQFSEALQTVREWRGIEGLDKTSDQLLANREQLLELARLMTPEQFAGMQTLLNDITTLGNEIQEIQSKLVPLENTLKDFTDTSLMDVLGNEKEIDNIISKIDDPIDSLEKLQQKVKDAKEAFRDSFGEASALLGKSGVNTFDEVFDKAQVKITSFLDTLHDLKGTDAFKGLSDEAKAELDKIDTEWDELLRKLNTMTPEESSQAFKAFFDRLSQVATASSDEIQREYEELLGVLNDPAIVTSLQQKQQQLRKIVNDFVTGQERMQRAAKIENYAKMAGGIAQVGSAIQQVQNLGSIWKNEDLTTGQKLLQTITNLAFSLPMLATGFTKATTALGLMETMTTAEAVAAGVSTSAQAAHAVSIGLVETASGAAAIKVQLLNTTLLLNPFVAFAAAAIGAATAIGFFIKQTEEANKALIENSKAQIEAENAKQEEIEKNKQLLVSLDDLDKQYKNGQISRSDMKSAVQDLIDQYGLEGEEIDKLAQSYDNLSGYIDKAREKLANEASESANRERNAAIQQVNATAKGKVFDEGQQSGDRYLLNIKSGISSSDQPEQIKQLLKQIGGVADTNGGTFRFNTEFDTASIVDLYDNLQSVVDKVNELRDAGEITQAQLQKSEYYQNMINWLGKMSESVERYRAAEEQAIKYDAELAAIIAQNNGKINLSQENIKTGNDYLREREKLIDEISVKLGKSKEDSADIADVYLRDNFKDLYTQFDEFSKAIEGFRDKFGGENSVVEQALGKLDEDHLGYLMNLIQLNPSVVSNWESLGNAINYIAEQDLSNLGAVNEMQANAADQYNIYQSLEDQVSSGKSISSKQLERLDPEIQQFFGMMANGTYKMTGDVQEFYDKVNNLKLDGFKDNLNQIYTELDKAKNLSSQNFDYDKLDQSAFLPGLSGEGAINKDLVQQQLAYLEAVSAGNKELEDSVALWKEQLQSQQLSTEQAKLLTENIAEAVGAADDQTKNLTEKTEELQAQARQLEQQLYDAMFPIDEDIDTSALEALSETLQDVADKSNELADSLSEDSRTAEDVAESILRFDDAIKDVVDNYDNWMAALNSGSIQQQAEAIDGLRDAYADLLDLDGSSLSSDFLTNTDNLELMKAAIDGNTEAYDELLSRAGQDIITHLQLSPEDYAQFQIDLAAIQSELDSMNYQDLEIGANLDTGNFITACQNLIKNADMTAKQATDYLASMGVDAEVIQQDAEATENHQNIEWQNDVTATPVHSTDTVMTGQGTAPFPVSYDTSVTEWNQVTRPVPVSEVAKKESKNFSLKVTSAHKSSGGHFKFSQSKNGGGSAGTSRRSNSGSSGGRRSSPSSGRKTKTKTKTDQPDTSTKELKDNLEDERDIYHDINIEIQQINRNLDRVQKQQDRLYGKELLNNLQKQSKILEQHKNKLKEKQKLQQEDLKQQQQALRNLGVTFDSYNRIANYMDILQRKQENINGLIDSENKLIKKYNKQTDKDAKKRIADRIATQDQRVKQAQDDYKELEDRIKKYDSLREDMEGLVDQIEDVTQQQIQINIKKFRMDVEIRLELGQAERDWNQFRREVLEHTDILKDTDFHKIFGDATRDYRDLISYFNVNGSKGSLEVLTNQLIATRYQIEAIDKTGNSAIYGDNKAQAMEDLQNDLKELMGQLEDVNGLIDDIDKAYLDTIDDIKDQFDKQIEDYEYVGDLIQHDIDLLSLLYGDKNYNAMDKYYTTLEDNNLKQLDSLRKQSDFWKQQWNDALMREDIQAAKQFEENYKETINKLNQTVEEAARNIQNKYVNAIDNIFNELDKKISNGRGTDYLSMQWDLMNKNANEYLDTINSAFAIQETERKYQNALNDAKSIKSQQALKALMDEQLGILKNKEKITQYDIDRANKLLQIEQARIALQNAQASKTSMRLKRDSQGNYSYEYTADEDAISNAQADLAQARNDLYNFDKDRYQSNLNDMLAAWRDFQSDYKDIIEDVSLTEQQRIERLALLRQQYGEYINDKTEQNLVVRTNLTESAFNDLAFIYKTDVENYNQMSREEQNILMEDLVPAWKSGIQEMSDTVAGAGGFIPTCEEAFNNVTDATRQYEQELDRMSKTTGVDLANVKNGVDDLALSFSQLIIKNDELKTKMEEEMTAINNLKTAAHDLGKEYESVYTAAELAVTGINDFLRAQRQKAASEAEAAKPKSSSSTSSNAGNSSSNSNSKSTAQNTSSKNKKKKKNDKDDVSDKLIEGIAGNIWVYGTWGDNPDRKNNMIAKFGKKKGEQIYKAVQAKFNSGYGYTKDVEHEWEYYKKYSLSSFRSGGYTGSWAGNFGKLAMLHQKQMVLNQEDTKNILNSVNIMRSIMSSLNGNMVARLGDIRTGYAQMISNNADGIEQNVHIDATFPNVNSKQQIEDAFNDLINVAAQRVMKR